MMAETIFGTGTVDKVIVINTAMVCRTWRFMDIRVEIFIKVLVR